MDFSTRSGTMSMSSLALGSSVAARMGTHPGDPKDRRDAFVRATNKLWENVQKESPDQVGSKPTHLNLILQLF